MVAKLDRTGEENYNSFGSKMIIKEYRTKRNINVYFPEYNWTAKSVEYGQFKKRNIKCPYEKRVYGKGYIGEGKYKVWESGKLTKCYNTWHDMLKRCYDDKHRYKNPTYENCEVTEEWLNYQNFAEWFYDNYYKIEGQRMCLDKDILHKGNKIYSPVNCIFVPDNINLLFVKCDKTRGEYPIGVCCDKRVKKFIARCRIYDFEENKSKRKNLGYYDTPQKAFKVYKQFKEQYIKEVADLYKEQIPNRLYNAMYSYEVEITD